MNILNVSTTDKGGAGIATVRIHLALLKQKYHSEIIFKVLNNKNIPNSFEIKFSPKILKKRIEQLKRKFYTRHIKLKELEAYTFLTSEYDITREECYKKADIIIIHWVGNFLGLKSFLYKNKKLYIYICTISTIL
jgi:hypothetical protein